MFPLTKLDLHADLHSAALYFVYFVWKLIIDSPEKCRQNPCNLHSPTTGPAHTCDGQKQILNRLVERAIMRNEMPKKTKKQKPQTVRISFNGHVCSHTVPTFFRFFIESVSSLSFPGSATSLLDTKTIWTKLWAGLGGWLESHNLTQSLCRSGSYRRRRHKRGCKGNTGSAAVIPVMGAAQSRRRKKLNIDK